jgi:hypothetical protein
MKGKKPNAEDELLNELDEELEDEEEVDDEPQPSLEDDVEEAEVDAQVKEMIQEFMHIPEVKGLVTEIAKDAVKRASDGVRNEAYNKVQKSFDDQFKALGERFQALEQAVGIEHQETPGAAEILGETDAIRKRMLELDKRAKELEDREKEIAESAETTRKSALESYRRGVIAEFGLSKVGHMVHGDSEDDIDDSVVEARKALNVMRREFIKEFKEKGWSPPAEELGEGGDESAVPTGTEDAAGLRQRFNYGPKQNQPGQTIVPS